ncbi:MAG: hypothetical protein ACO3VQ_12200 [Ilumatobacteraceae bacterium]
MSNAGVQSLSLRDRVTIALLCGIAWMPIALVRGGYSWDDWLASVLTRDEMRLQSRQLGRLFPFSSEVFYLGGSQAVRILTVVALVVTGLAAASVISRFGVLTKSEVVIIATLTAINPLDTAKSLLATAPYSWSLAFFFVGWFLITSRRWWIFAFPLLFVSYDTNSLLFFSLLPLADLIFFGQSWRHPLIRTKIAGLSLTVASYAAIRFVTRVPEGPYDGYNEIGVVRLVFLLTCLGGLILLALGLLRGRRVAQELQSSGHLVAAVGIVLVLVGLIPYLVDGQLPPYLGTRTRHYLLIGLGLGVIVVGLSRAMASLARMRRSQTRFMVAAVLSALSFVWINNFLSLHHWRFVDAITEEISSLDVREDSLVIVSYEETPDVVLSKRLGPNHADQWYVWTYIVDQGGEEGIFAIHEGQLRDYLGGRMRGTYGETDRVWGVSSFKPTASAIRLDFESNGGIFGFFAEYEVSVSEVEVALPLE